MVSAYNLGLGLNDYFDKKGDFKIKEQCGCYIHQVLKRML
jgi:hypothetical protein